MTENLVASEKFFKKIVAFAIIYLTNKFGYFILYIFAERLFYNTAREKKDSQEKSSNNFKTIGTRLQI